MGVKNVGLYKSSLFTNQISTMATKNVTIYSTPSCQYCKKTKNFLNENDVDFTDYNVADDTDKRKEMLEKSGQMGVPVVIVSEDDSDEGDMIVGFDKDALTKLLDL